MRAFAIAKHVPDSRIAVRVHPDGSGLETQGLKFVCDPFDEIGIEQAIRLKASRSNLSEIVVLTVAPGASSAVDTLRHGLAMGADRAVHVVCDDIGPHEELRCALLAARAIQRLAADGDAMGLVLCGARSTDNGAGEFGPALAEFLGLPHAGSVTKLELGDRSARAASRSITGGEIVLDVDLPAVVTCERGLVEPHHPALPKLMKAKKQPIEVIDASELGEAPRRDATLVQLAPPPARQSCRMFEGDPQQVASELLRALREEVKVL